MSNPSVGVPLPLLFDDVAYLGRAIEADDYDAMAHGVGACVWLTDRGELRSVAVAVYSLVAGRLDAVTQRIGRSRRFPHADGRRVEAEAAAEVARVRAAAESAKGKAG